MKSLPNLTFIAAVSLIVAVASGCQRDTSESATSGSATTDQPANEQSSGSSGQGMGQQGSGSSAVGDAAITSQVKAALTEVPELQASEINVDTSDGVVTLRGSIDSPQKMDRAAQVAQNVNGVKSVKNELSLKSQG